MTAASQLGWLQKLKDWFEETLRQFKRDPHEMAYQLGYDWIMKIYFSDDDISMDKLQSYVDGCSWAEDDIDLSYEEGAAAAIQVIREAEKLAEDMENSLDAI